MVGRPWRTGWPTPGSTGSSPCDSWTPTATPASESSHPKPGSTLASQRSSLRPSAATSTLRWSARRPAKPSRGCSMEPAAVTTRKVRPTRCCSRSTADYWNRAMPFMFEREGDFTELLIPANLLADDSVLNRAVKVLTDGRVPGRRGHRLALPVLHLGAEGRGLRRVQEEQEGRRRRDPRRHPALHAALDRPLPRRELARPTVDAQPPVVSAGRPDGLLHRPGRRGDRLPQDQQPEELKVIDPACGSGHMLTYAFDLLYAIYEEEGYAPPRSRADPHATTSTAPRSTRAPERSLRSR